MGKYSLIPFTFILIAIGAFEPTYALSNQVRKRCDAAILGGLSNPNTLLYNQIPDLEANEDALILCLTGKNEPAALLHNMSNALNSVSVVGNSIKVRGALNTPFLKWYGTLPDALKLALYRRAKVMSNAGLSAKEDLLEAWETYYTYKGKGANDLSTDHVHLLGDVFYKIKIPLFKEQLAFFKQKMKEKGATAENKKTAAALLKLTTQSIKTLQALQKAENAIKKMLQKGQKPNVQKFLALDADFSRQTKEFQPLLNRLHA